MSKHRTKCECRDRCKDEERALLAKLEEDFCRKKCALEEAIRECERRCKALKNELRELEKCYEKERKCIKRRFD